MPIYSLFKAFIISSFSLFVCMATLLVSLFFLWVFKKRKVAKTIAVFSFLYLLIFSLPFLPNALLGYLERQYPELGIDEYVASSSDIRYIVVLAGGHTFNDSIPITSQFSYSGLVRLIEGVRLYYKKPGTKLILSGGRGRDSVTDAELMAELSVALGIPKNDIILETESTNTYDEARFIRPVVGKERFFLVTSALHMPRSMALFKKQEMNPIAVPTDHLVKNMQYSLPSLIPMPGNLLKADLAFYEYFGLIKEKLTGHI